MDVRGRYRISSLKGWHRILMFSTNSSNKDFILVLSWIQSWFMPYWWRLRRSQSLFLELDVFEWIMICLRYLNNVKTEFDKGIRSVSDTQDIFRVCQSTRCNIHHWEKSLEISVYLACFEVSWRSSLELRFC